MAGRPRGYSSFAALAQAERHGPRGQVKSHVQQRGQTSSMRLRHAVPMHVTHFVQYPAQHLVLFGEVVCHADGGVHALQDGGVVVSRGLQGGLVRGILLWCFDTLPRAETYFLGRVAGWLEERTESLT